MQVIDGLAEVTMNLSDAAYPLHTDATAMVRPVTLLGERYVDLDRGSANAPLLKPGVMLPPKQTGQSTDLDQVLNALDDPTGTALAALVTTLGEGADGNGANLAAAIKALAPAMTDTGKLAQLLGHQNTLLANTLDSIEPVAAALADDHGKTLSAVVNSADELLGTTAANSDALKQVLDRLPQTLSTARTTLAALAGTANAAVPTLNAIRPITDNLSQISDELAQFAKSADPALASAEPVLQKAQQLLTNAQPVAAELQAAGPSLLTDAKSAQPVVSQLSSNIDNVLNFLKFWALSTNGYDGLSHYFRGVVIVTPAIVTGLVPGLGGNLGLGGSPSTASGAPTGTPTTPATSKGAPVTNLLGGLLGGLLAPKTSSDGGVTGLTKSQEQGGLLALLGLGGI
jgi:phospholipid/cholesterol/gamma-HCH transport system substrate-binding protein